MARLPAVPRTLVGLMEAAVPPPEEITVESVPYLIESAEVVPLFAFTVALSVALVEVTLAAALVVAVGARAVVNEAVELLVVPTPLVALAL